MTSKESDVSEGAVERLAALAAAIGDRHNAAFKFGDNLVLRSDDLRAACAALSPPLPSDVQRIRAEAFEEAARVADQLGGVRDRLPAIEGNDAEAKFRRHSRGQHVRAATIAKAIRLLIPASPLPSPGVERLRKTLAKAAPLIDATRKTNAPAEGRPGQRIVGFVLDESVAGLSDGLLMLDALQEVARAALSALPLDGGGCADQWRCVHCKAVVASSTEPEQCAECRHRTFAKIDQPPLTPAARTPQADEYTPPDC